MILSPIWAASSASLALLRFSLPTRCSLGVSAWSPAPSPGHSRDLLQDGEHPAPRAGPTRHERLVVHDHPLVVVPAGRKEGGLNGGWSRCPASPAR